MAQNAELLLKVGLDLSHFRQQLTTIGSQLAGQPLSINIKFDRAKIVSEFRLLDRYIRNKKFRVEINTNLKAEVERAEKLAEKLGEIKRIASGISGVSSQAARGGGMAGNVTTASYKELQALYKFATAAKIPFAQLARGARSSAAELQRVLAPAFADVAEDIKKGIATGLADANSTLAKLGRGMGESLLNAMKTSLGIASPSKETGKLGKFAAQGFEQGFVSGIVKAERSMARAIRASLMGAIREGLSNLPGMGGALVSFERQLAASVQLAVRKAVRQGLREAIAPGTKGGLLGGTGGAVTGATVGGAKALGAGVAGGVAKLTAGGLMGTAANLARYSIDSSAYQEFVGKLYQEIIHAALSTGSQGAIIGALAVGGVTGGLAFARGASGSLILQAVTAIRNRILAALLAVSTGDLNNIAKVMVRDVTGLIARGLIRQLRAATAELPSMAPAGLLPGTSQTTARRTSVAAGLQAIYASDSPAFPEGPSGKLALTAEALKKRVDAILAEYFKVVEVTIKEVFDPQDLRRALRVFSFLPQALRDAETRTQLAQFEVPRSFGVLPEVSKTTARRTSVAAGLQAIFAAGGPTFPEGPSGKLALTAEALKARIDVILAESFKVAEVRIPETFNVQDLTKALRIFSFLPQALRDAETRTQLARFEVPGSFGVLPEVSQTTARRTSVAAGLQAIYASDRPAFPEEPLGKLALTAKALKARIDVILAEYFKVVEVTIKEVFDPQDLIKALRIFSFLPQALRDAELRTAGLLGAFGRERTYTGRLQVDPQASSRAYQRFLPPATMKLLDLAAGIGGTGAQEQVVSAFFARLRASTQMFAKNFSANSYLPQSTRKLAAAMDSAATALRLLTPAKIAGFLPSRELMDKRKFASAIQKAIVIDMTNALRQQMEGRMLPAAGGTQGFQRMLGDRQPLYRAPGIGPARPKIDMTGKVLPVEEQKRFQDALRKAAEIDANNAAKAATIAARNAARAAFIALRQEVNRGLLPAAGQTFASRRKDPGVSGIFDAMTQQMGFGAGQRYALGGPAQLRLPAAGMTGLGAAQAERVRRAYERSTARERTVLEEGMGIAGFRRTIRGAGGGVGAGGGFPSDTLPMGSQRQKINTVLDVASTSMENFRASQVPLLGGLREIGGEFAIATKQVLLYGTAYKALAFVTALPGQILNAAKSQQQYNNALQTATQDTGTFAKELLYVDNVQRTFGLNLETTRTGFTRLYASMAPAGFDSGSIEKLFTGISAATAALQLTPDKAERVIYAFGQMASKGQIMSEELKGQLGDVLPGALAIFSKATGMSVKDFSKAMEDGAFVGGKFREVFAKVSDELMTRFGTGAQAAGQSLQGLLNTVQGDFQRTMESFAPLANVAAQSILGPLSGALKQLSMSAQLAMGEQERVAKQLADAKASNANAQSIAALEARLRGLQEAAKDPAIAQQAKNIQSFVAEISKAGTAVMSAASAIGNVLNPFLTFLGTNLSTAATLLISFSVGFAAVRLAITAAMAVLTLFNVAVKALAGGAIGVNALSAAFRALGISAGAAQIGVVGLGAAMKVLLFSSGLGIAVALLTAIGTAALSMGSGMRQAAQDARQAMQDMAQAAIVGNTALIQMRAATYKANIATLNAMQAEILKGGGRRVSSGRATTRQVFDISPVQQQLLQAVPGVVLPQGPATQQDIQKAINDAKYIQQTGLQAATKFQQISQANETKLGLNKPQPTAIPPEPVGGGKKNGGGDKAANDAKRLAEEIARQAAAASDALFTEQQRLRVLQQTNPVAKTIVEYTNQELAIQRELTNGLKEAKSEKEKASLREVARLKSSSNLLDLQNSLNDAGKEGMQRLEDAIKTQKEELFVNGEIEKLLREKVSPERAKQIADTRLLVKNQLESLDLSIAQAEAAAEEAKARGNSVTAVENAIAKLKQRRGEMVSKGAELEAGIPMAGGSKTARDYLTGGLDEARTNLEQLTNSGYQLVQVAGAIGDAFGNAFKGLITGSMTAQEALAGFFSSIADHFADMVAKMIAEWLKAQLIQGFLNFIGAIIPGAGALGSIASGGFGSFSQPSSFGIGPMSLPGLSGAGALNTPSVVPSYAGIKFANGGIVTGPTLGLVGEGRYNEAIVPLPNGRSIPVELGGGMGGVSVVVNVDATGSEAAGNEGQAKALGNAISAAVQSEIIKQKRPGGLLAR